MLLLWRCLMNFSDWILLWLTCLHVLTQLFSLVLMGIECTSPKLQKIPDTWKKYLNLLKKTVKDFVMGKSSKQCAWVDSQWWVRYFFGQVEGNLRQGVTATSPPKQGGDMWDEYKSWADACLAKSIVDGGIYRSKKLKKLQQSASKMWAPLYPITSNLITWLTWFHCDTMKQLNATMPGEEKIIYKS